MAAKANKAYTDFPGTVGLKTSAKAPSLDAKFVEIISAPATPEERILKCEHYEIIPSLLVKMSQDTILTPTESKQLGNNGNSSNQLFRLVVSEFVCLGGIVTTCIPALGFRLGITTFGGTFPFA
jgi:hypothetical protein